MTTSNPSFGKPREAWRLPAKGAVRVVENVFVPARDGESLALQIWLPEDSGERPAPVVLEAIPYRKRDRYRAYDTYWGQILAQHGVAYARLDARGSGDSAGALMDEYLAVEQADCADVIAWLAAQPWSNGAVGMRGVSWGGFSTLQTAALAPRALKAIMPMCASDMRFTDDAHYVGGAFALTGLKWATSFKLVAAGPPDPRITGEVWREAWQLRLDATAPIAARWLSHQTNDDYWRHGSVALDLPAIKCPVYLVGGLVDPYGDVIPRLLCGLKVPCKAIHGPWRHGYPEPCAPGPGLDWAWEEIRWWKHWLAGEATGIMDEPALRVFMPDATASQASPGPLPGRWVAEAAWPSAAITSRTLFLGAGGLCDTAQPGEFVTVRDDAIVGLGKVEWVPFAPSEQPREQSPDDARSTVFETEPLPSPMEILGVPTFHARVASNRPVARLAARLCEVAADGQSWLVAWGLLNLTHRDGHEAPSPLQPGVAYEIDVALNFVAHRFQPGSRIRLAVSENLWPLVWPSPRVVTLTLDTAASHLELPQRAAPPNEPSMPIAAAPAMPSNPASWPILKITEHDGAARVEESWPPSTSDIAEIEMTVSGSGPNVSLTMTAGDPLSCVWRAEQSSGYRRPDWRIELRTEVSIRADATHFHVQESLRATLDGEVVCDVAHSEAVERVWM